MKRREQTGLENEAFAESADDENSISKSARKRQMLALQDIGEELVRLSPDTLRAFALPERLLEAVLDAKRINPNKHGGFKRQMQYIGKLMREVDAEPIAARLEELKAPSRKTTALHHLAEEWRLRLLADPTAVTHFARDFLDGDGEAEAALQQLVADACAERAGQRGSRPPTLFRALFRTLLKHIERQAESIT